MKTPNEDNGNSMSPDEDGTPVDHTLPELADSGNVWTRSIAEVDRGEVSRRGSSVSPDGIASEILRLFRM
ncbi:MAG: hypothetical protein C0404_06050 [Verrucomicrobia bacterium]|nr:hypothetical protein [Verrucomicrobiota bacterium]